MLHFPDRIVLIANVKKIPDKGYAKHMSSFDITKRISNKLLARAIKKNGYELVEYSDINNFIKNIEQHKNDLVFPYHFGVASKIRQSYVQTICETQNIKYIGGDAYSQTIGNDKALSKEICRYSEITTPTFKILFDKNYPPDISVLNFPVIVKPQFEGDSIGISDANVFFSETEVLPFAIKLQGDLNQPILIEEYIEGKELSICLIGYKRTIKKMYIVENINKKSLVSSYNDKKFKLTFEKYRDAKELLTGDIVNKITNLFHSLDKLEFVRLDFIFKNDTFYNIELTVDTDLSPYSCMYIAVKKEMSYTEFIGLLISNCLERYKHIESVYS